MQSYSFVHLASDKVLREYDAVESRENADTATALALLGEIDARKLYVAAGFPSMYAYCLEARHMSEDRACKRIRVARAAREFPEIYPAVAEGRLHLSALFLLAPYLTPDTADALLAAAVHKTKAQTEQLIAQRFPKPDLPALVQPLHVSRADARPVPQIEQNDPCMATGSQFLPAPGRVVAAKTADGSMTMVPPAPPSAERARVAPLSAERFGVQFTMDQRTHDLLRDVQSLLGPNAASRDIARVFALALECFKAKLEGQKFGKCSRPGERRGSKNLHYVPDEIKRAVWERDGGRCTFIGTGGKRCEARESLEFDHVHPVARGGRSTVEGVRLLCHAHNQYMAEREFGTDFMNGKRERAREAATKAKSQSRSAPRLGDQRSERSTEERGAVRLSNELQSTGERAFFVEAHS